MQMKLPAGHSSSQRMKASVALARAILPTTSALEGASERTVRHTESFLSRVLPEALEPWRAAQWGLSEAARAFTGRSLAELPAREAEELVAKWATHPIMRKPVNGIAAVYKITHFDLPDTKGSLRTLRTVDNAERPRWMQQIVRAEDFDADEELECDVVVIGTGAGGAVVGKHLADQGHAVVFVEEGEHVQRHQFPGNFMSTVENLYRNVITVGNATMLIPQGRLVGGSTAVNTGTSFRPPRWVTDRWSEELQSDEFSQSALTPYFQSVENILQVEPADLNYVGPTYEMFKRGCEKLGWHSETAQRNAPGCRGEGMCDNGCPTDARRSTAVTYLPSALERGAMILSGMRAEKVLMDQGRAVGIEGVALDKFRNPVRLKNGREKRVRIKARSVIVSGGAMTTPTFLLKQGLANSSDQLGRNLTLHPSGPALGLFDELIDGEKFIPQSIYSHQFLKEGFMLVGAQADNHMVPPTLPLLGRRLMTVLEKVRHLVSIGYLIADDSRGRVRVGPGGRTLMTYNFTKSDVIKLHKGLIAASQVLLAAGAREVFPGLLYPMTIRDQAGIERLSKMKLGSSDFLMTSYHPLGTAKMSRDPRRGVVDLNHQCHDVPGLFIVDGSSVQGPLGVNPQISIMALATRAAEKIGPLVD